MKYYIDDKNNIRRYSDNIVDLFQYLPNKKPEVNIDALREYIFYQFYSSSETLFKNIYRQRPPLLKNFHFDYDDDLKEKEAIKTLAFLINKSVKESFFGKSADMIGFSLSGGVDSSLVTGVAASLFTGRSFDAFSGIFLHENYNEWEYIKEVKKKYPNIIVHPVIITEDDFLEKIQNVMGWLEEPCGGPGSFSQFMVYEEAWACGKNTLFTGEGGDELWLGYDRYLDLPRYFESITRCKFPLIYNKDIFDIDCYFPQMFNSIDDVMMGEIQYNLPTLLAIDEKLTKAFNIETQSPLLSKEIIKFAQEVPQELRFKNNELKYLLKKAGEAYLPKKILDRTDKMGFPTPFVKWLQSNTIVREFFFDIFSSQKTKERGIFNCDEVLKVVDLETEYGRTLWGALSIEIWLRSFID